MRNFWGTADNSSINKNSQSGNAGSIEKREEKTLKRIRECYDMSDEIYEKRHDTSSANQGTEYISENSEGSRITQLKELLAECRGYGRYRDKTDIYISANITMGNIYMRISHCYLDVFEYEMARSCAKRGSEHLWNALQEHQLQYNNKTNIYKLLIHLNLAKCCREWATLTRRSNYELAIKQLEIVLSELREINGELGNTEWKGKERQIALLCVDVMVNKGKILRMDYFLEKSDAYLRGLALSLLGTETNMEGENRKKIHAILANASGKEESERIELIKYLEYLSESDRKAYLLSALTQLSLVWIKQRKYDMAEELTREINAYEKDNHDAKNHRGVCYRKMGKPEKAAKEFLDVVKTEAAQKIELDEFIKNEAERNRNKGNHISEERDRGFFEKQVNRFAYINLLKCVLDLCMAGDLDHAVFTNAMAIIDNHLKYNPCDYEAALLKSRYLIQDDRLEEAMDLLKGMTQKSELSYVRRGTIGLKVRYLFSECYLKKYCYNEAENLLMFIRTELHKDGTGKKENQLDPLVENNIGWCLMNQGRNEEALKCYQELVDDIWNPRESRNEGKTKISIIDKLKDIFGESMEKFFDQTDVQTELSSKEKDIIRQWENRTSIKVSCLNNMGECFLRAGTSNADPDNTENKANAKKIFDLILRIEPDNGMAYLHRGYCEKEIEEKAKWFKKAFQYAPYQIEVRSCYLINMVEMYSKARKEELSEAIQNFIHYMPYTYSVNMCLALLRWKSMVDPDYFLDTNWKKATNAEGDLNPQEESIQKEREDFCKVFSRIELFPELGTRAFEKLKEKSGFRHLKAVERGRIITYLLYLYEPIIKIRKSCHFHYDDWKKLVEQTLVVEEDKMLEGKNSRKSGRNRSGLVHYTGLDTLKKLLDQSGTPHLRVSNSGYMNDSSEGEIFFEEMRYVVKDEARKANSDEKEVSLADEIDGMIQCYFHELQGDPDRVLPRGGNVYITSLSTQADSFPMWDIYAGKEQGCNIEFNENFFDLKGSSWGTLAGSEGSGDFDYSISTYTDDNYPLYAIQYVYRDHYAKKGQEPNLAGFCSRDGKNETGSCRMKYEFFENCLSEIAHRWNILHKLLGSLTEKYAGQEKSAGEAVGNKVVEDAVNEIRAFVADRINEVRYLFKDRDYNFEGEVRMVRVVEVDDTRAQTDSREIPRAFTEVDREIEGIIVTLASKLSDEQVNEITTWLKHTGRVKDVRLATRNRLRQSVVQQAKMDF